MSNRNKWGNEVSGSIIAACIACSLMLFLQQDITNWKAAYQLQGDMQVISDQGTADGTRSVVFYTGFLSVNGALTDPVHGLTLPQVAGVSVTEEKYRQRYRRSHWRNVNTDTAFMPAWLNQLEISEDLLSKNGSELWRKMRLEQFDISPLRTSADAYVSGSHYYTRLYHRYSYRYIPANGEVTAVAALARSSTTGAAILSPAPGMPETYPALWPGQIDPADFLETLHNRMMTALISSGGVLTLMGWFIMLILQPLSNRLPINSSTLALVSVGAAAGAMASWLMTANWLIALPVWLGLAGLGYTLVHSSFFNREPIT